MTTVHLTEQKCEACEGGVAPLTREEAETLRAQTPEWQLTGDATGIYREYERADFMSALTFLNRVGDIAEQEGHHPDLHLLDYKHVRIELSTHAIGGLSHNDFIVAAKIDALDS